ncbi:MAG: hypothetical protein ACLQLE_16195 [Desulfobaccales bacterium]
MAVNDDLCTFEDRSCPFKDKCDPNCALYMGGAKQARGDCAFTISGRRLNEIKDLMLRFYEKMYPQQ